LYRKFPESLQTLCSRPIITAPKTIQDQDTIQKTALSIQKAEVQPHVVESDMESFRYSENPKETLRAIFQKAARNIPPTKPASLVKNDPVVNPGGLFFEQMFFKYHIYPVMDYPPKYNIVTRH